jgi:hypothetical protein
VESEQIRNALGGLGMSEAQGWLFGRAVSGESVRTFLGLKKNGRAGDTPGPVEGDGYRFTPRIRRG